MLGQKFLSILLTGVLIITVCAIAVETSACDVTANWNQPYLSDDCTVGLWHLDEDDGTAVDDASPNDLTGSIYGTPDWNAGQPGFDGAMHCGGTNFLQVPDNDAMTGMSQLTLECWFKLDSYGYDFWNYLFEKGGSYTVVVVDADQPNRDKLWAKITTNIGSYSILSDYKVPLDIWTHVAVTYDGAAMKMFINGQLEVETAASGVISNSSTPLYVGSNNLGYQTNIPMHGWIDEARISNIARQYNGMMYVNLDIKPGSCPNPINIKLPGSEYINVGGEDIDETGGSMTGAAKRGQNNMHKKAVLPAAILGTADFDVALIEVMSIDMFGSPVLRWNYEDVATPLGENAEPCECNTLGPDGYVDLTLKFDRQAVIDALGDVPDGQQVHVTISGLLTDGTAFEGQDCLLILAEAEAADDPLVASNFPNPFNPTTTISFNLPTAGHTAVEIFNVAGQHVTMLLSEYREAGQHAVVWDGTSANGTRAASGIYFYRISTDSHTAVKKMIMLK